MLLTLRGVGCMSIFQKKALRNTWMAPYTKVGQPPARGPDPAHEGLASGPPPCSAITLQSGLRNPSQTKAGFMSEITSRECTNSEHFGRRREQRCTLRRLLIKYKNSKSRCRQTNSNNYNVGLGRFGQPSTSYAWRLWPFLKSLTCDATGRQSIEHQTSGRCLLRRGKTPSIDCQATCRKQLRSSASKLLRPTR